MNMTTYDTGATRTDDGLRDDPEGYLSPLMIEAYCEYMTKHRVQDDGTVRSSDNWQKGMPEDRAWKGLWRHFLHAWMRHRGFEPSDPHATGLLEDDLMAMLFNINVIVHQRRAAENEGYRDVDWTRVVQDALDDEGHYPDHLKIGGTE